MQLKQQISKLVPLAIIVVGLLGYNFLFAQWQNPTATAPNNNTEAPINVSANYQAKLGDLGAVRMRAGQYCNADGTVCVTAGGLSGGTWGAWANVTGSRTANTWYQNNLSTGRMVYYRGGDSAEAYVSVNGTVGNQVMVGGHAADSGQRNTGSFVVPPGHYYRLTSILTVSELQLPI